MKIVRTASFEEYVQWYLLREYAKNHNSKDDPEQYKTLDELKQYMRVQHDGKVRDWFHLGKWFIVQLDISETDNLVCLDGAWTMAYLIPDEKRGEKNFRILSRFVEYAQQREYFAGRGTAATELGKRCKYYNEFQSTNTLRPLREADRIVLCSLSSEEKAQNPAGTYYLHDGLGRLLTRKYLIAAGEKKLEEPVEAFLAENPGCVINY